VKNSLILLFVIFFQTLAPAGIVPPLYVGNTEIVRDEYGRPMRGTCLVEIRKAEGGIIRPPDTNGFTHPLNPLASSNCVGKVGMNSMSPDSGLFCVVFPFRPEVGSKIFARAYNSSTYETSTFYADSTACEVPLQNKTSLILNFSSARAIDPNDDDNDGLNNSWESLLGIDDRLTPDYDGDGMVDYYEMLAGTAPDDPDSIFAFSAANPQNDSEEVEVAWQSIPGKRYQIQYLPELPVLISEEIVIIDVGDEILAGPSEFEKREFVTIPSGAVKGYFRVKLVID
jgi:hypothetical protein